MLNHPPRRLLGVWAHPDDEAYLSAGLMLRTTASGGHVTSVTATLGEHGFADDDPRPLAERKRIRRCELDAALAAVGVHDGRDLGFADGALAEVAQCRLVDAIVETIDDVSPDVIITFGPDGITGHPDHIAVSHATTVAHRQRPSARLLHATHPQDFLDRFAGLHAQLGIHMDDEAPPTGVHPRDIAVSVWLGDEELDAKRLALGAHASQTAPLIEAMGDDLYREWVRAEWFRVPVRQFSGATP